jgi:hypothetical protein
LFFACLPISLTKGNTIRNNAAKAAQKTKGKPGLKLAKLFPIGGEAKLPNREQVRTSPVAVPEYVAPTPSVSITIVNRIAINPSRTTPASRTEAHTIGPVVIDNSPTPIAVINVVANRTVFLELSLFDNRAIGTAPKMLAPWNAAKAPSALAAVHPISLRYNGR